MENIGFRLKIFLLTMLVIMALGTIGFMAIERLSFSDALYFSIVTVTTVGYGDITPSTEIGKVFAVFLIITGVGTFLGVVANATEMLLNKRESRMRMEKLNMVIGVFFSEIGTKFLTVLIDSDSNINSLRQDFLITGDWSDKQFLVASKKIKNHNFNISYQKIDFKHLNEFLDKKGTLFLRLFENPSILEHGPFTELLRAILHLKEELVFREDFKTLPETDYQHLAGDINRAYALLTIQWLDYMLHLKKNYPYLFSLALRTNPFDRDRTPVVK